MELIVLLLSSISGALIGTSVGIYLLYRKLRPITGAELDLTRGKLRSTEYSLSTATANLDNLRKQLEEREQAAQESSQQLSAAEEKARELEARVRDETKAAAESASRQIASYEDQIDADERQIQELNGQVARLNAELALIKDHFEQESHSRAALDTQLSAEFDHSRGLASRIAELEAERSHFDLTLQEERQSAAKGIELLLMAQENLTRVFKPAPAHGVPNDSNGHVLVGAIADNSPELA